METNKRYVWSRERGLRCLKPEADFTAYRAKYPSAKLVKHPPSVKILQKWNWDGYCLTIDGCKVEPDGECCHGYPSWMRAMGVI